MEVKQEVRWPKRLHNFYKEKLGSLTLNVSYSEDGRLVEAWARVRVVFLLCSKKH